MLLPVVLRAAVHLRSSCNVKGSTAFRSPGACCLVYSGQELSNHWFNPPREPPAAGVVTQGASTRATGPRGGVKPDAAADRRATGSVGAELCSRAGCRAPRSATLVVDASEISRGLLVMAVRQQ